MISKMSAFYKIVECFHKCNIIENMLRENRIAKFTQNMINKKKLSK